MSKGRKCKKGKKKKRKKVIAPVGAVMACRVLAFRGL